MLHDKKTTAWTRIKEGLATKPAAIVLLLSIILLSRLILLGPLVYGDVGYFDTRISKVNFLYVWGEDRLGTNVRQSFSGVYDALRAFFFHNDSLFFLTGYLLPLLLIPTIYYFLFRKLGIQNRFALIFSSLFPLFTPIVFGDFLNGQSFWVYITLPWVFYFTIKIYLWHEFSFRDYVLLALFLFLSLSALPPIIVPLIPVLILFVLITFVLNISVNSKLIAQYIVAGATTVFFFALMALPYMLIASTGQAAYSSPNIAGDYYNNYAGTTLTNTLRSAGNNGNGQVVLGYNSPSAFTIFGYAILTIIVGGVSITGNGKSRRYRSTVACCFAIVLIILGFLHLMSVNVDFGLAVFHSQWIASTIRNPTKLFVLLLPFLAILMALGLENLMRNLHITWQKNLLVVFLVIAVCIYGWPTLQGDFGLISSRKAGLQSVKKDPALARLTAKLAQTNHNKDRSLLIPSSHRDELNYQAVTPGLNVLRLEGSLPSTANLLTQLRTSFNNQNPYFFNYLNAAGIENIFIKKNFAPSQADYSTLFPTTLSSSEIADFLRNLPTQDITSDFLQFTNPNPNDLIYSPQSITSITGDEGLKTKAPFLQRSTAVIGETDKIFSELVTNYESKTKLTDNETIEEGKAQLYDPNLVLAEIYAEQGKDKTQLVVNVIDPISGNIDETTRHEIPSNAEVLYLNDRRVTFSSKKKRVTLRAGKLELRVASLQNINLDNDPSFEKTVPQPGDASMAMRGEPGIYSKTSDDALDGQHSLLLGTNNHLAYVEKTLQLDGGESKDYLLRFDSKNNSGEPGRYSLLQGDTSLATPGNVNDTKKKIWQQNDIFFTSSDNTSPAELYFYSYTHDNKISENLFDNIELARLHQVDSFQIELKRYLPDYDLTGHKPVDIGELANQNLLNNGSFEDNHLWNVGDATLNAPGQADFKVIKNDDAIDGGSSLQLESKNHTVYVAQSATTFDPNTIYKLSFHYKHVAGKAPVFAIWQDGSSVAYPSKQLETKSDWTYFESYFVPEEGTTNLTLYLYSNSSGDKTINLFDNVHLEVSSLISNYLVKQRDAIQKPQNLVMSYKRLSPVLLQADVSSGNGMIVFNESYHTGWRAFIVRKDRKISFSDKAFLEDPGIELSTKNHVMVNGFANGWWINSQDIPENVKNSKGEYEIVLAFMPQRQFYLGLIVSDTTLIGIGSYLAYDSKRRRHNMGRWQRR